MSRSSFSSSSLSTATLAAHEDARRAARATCSSSRCCGQVRSFRTALRPDDAGVVRAISVCTACGSLLVVPVAPVRGDVSTPAPRIPRDSFGDRVRSAESAESATLQAILDRVDAESFGPEWRWAS